MLVIKCYLCPEAKMLPMSWINPQPKDIGYLILDSGCGAERRSANGRSGFWMRSHSNSVMIACLAKVMTSA